jgi:hypothetical protein
VVAGALDLELGNLVSDLGLCHSPAVWFGVQCLTSLGLKGQKGCTQ